MKNRCYFFALFALGIIEARDLSTMIDSLRNPVFKGACQGSARISQMPFHVESPFNLTEFLIDTSKYLQLPDGYNRYPGIAYDGVNFMAVWMDYAHARIVGSRIAPDGSILDQPPFSISTSVSQDQPDIVFDGTNYFVVWAVAPNIYGARVAPDGTVLDPDGIIISNTGSYNVAVACGAGVYLVAWNSTVGQHDALAAIVDTGGTLLCDFALADDAQTSESWPNVSFNGSNFLAVWYVTNIYTGDYGIRASRILPDGTNLDPGGIPVSNQSGDMWPVIDWDGANWFVVWSQSIGGGFHGAWITPAGTPFGTFNIPGSYGMTFPEMVYGDSIHWVEAIDIVNPNIYATRIDFDGNVLNDPWMAVDTSAGWQAYGGNAYGDSTFIAVWEDQVTYDIYARRYAPTGASKDSTRFVVNIFDSVTNTQYGPNVAFDGANYLAVYADSRNPADDDILGSRITTSGTLLDPEGFQISSRAPGYLGEPKIAFGDSLYLVVWGTGTDIWGARILPDGTVIDPGGFQITTGGTENHNPSVAYSNGNFLVVYNRITGSPAIYRVFGTRIRPNGQILDPNGFIILNINDHNRYGPEVAGYAHGFLTTWYLFASPAKIEGTRVSFQGAVIDSPAVQISPANLGVDYAGLHSVARGGDTFLVVWHRNNQEINGCRIDSSGAVLDPTPLAICGVWPNSRTQPSVVFNGKHFLVVWSDSRSAAAQNEYDLFGTRVSSNGMIPDTSGTELINAADSRGNAELASATPNPDTGAQVLVVFDGYVGGAYNSNRALGAFHYPSTSIKEDDARELSNACRVDITPNVSRQKPYLLSYSLTGRTEIRVDLYDITGRLVKGIYHGEIGKPAGQVEFTLAGMAAGVYFVRIDADGKTATTKVIWLR